MQYLGARVKAASAVLANITTAEKDEALKIGADCLVAATSEILEANCADIERAQIAGTPDTVIDRLRLDTSRVDAMGEGLRQLVALTDPIGKIVEQWTRPNGLEIQKVRVPLGVVAIIYENRPNVTSDAFGLCLKSGNAAFLRGSSAAIDSNIAIARALREGITKAGLPEDALMLVTDTSYEAAIEFMQLRDHIDCLIPRGGPSLINSILDNAKVPYVIDGDGNCHVYVDEAADLDLATNVIVNAKMQRPSVCNAAESLVVHSQIAPNFLPRITNALEGVELVGDERSRDLVPSIQPATEEDWSTEYLDLKMSVRIVDNIDEAITHINKHSTGHSEAIISSNQTATKEFARRVDAAAVLVNTSTRFVDGEEFGFGAEIGISTQKLHARGPMGLEQLTTTKYIVNGQGQTRG
ncbi:MAG TPA: glutamate-5-semialdehyde dehydrogenase [Acidimicrobiaceae bacterium]|nr:glutamate-5-semialdehyde dehydrogenase [Acidimicrobiaceae bacterium]|tara:strand:+ start:3347 stop:4579 length:1233 start_codon:yes stop_codon:yes gene_type:complete